MNARRALIFGGWRSGKPRLAEARERAICTIASLQDLKGHPDDG